LELRTKLDWLLPHIGNNTDNLVEGIAQKKEPQFTYASRPKVNQELFDKK
jgi:hypothetical protein